MLRLISRNVIPSNAVLNSTPLIEALGFGSGLALNIELIEQNIRPSTGNYACIVKIWDFWRLSRTRCRDAAVQHFSEAIEAEIIRDVSDRRAILVFDLSNEGPEFQSEFFDEIHLFADSHSIPYDRIVWLAQNRKIEADYYKHYGKIPAHSISFEYYDYYVKLMAHWFANTPWRDARTGGDHKYAATLLDYQSKANIALCLNATSRKHRILTLAQLSYMGLLSKSEVSFGGTSYPKGHPLDTATFLEDLRATNDYSYLITHAEEILNGGRRRIDKFEDFGNQLVDKIDINQYTRTFFSILTETDFSDGSISRVTEKLVKICCLGHPFVVVGNPYSLDHIEAWGFQSFRDIIDQRYDKICQPEIRFRLLFNSVNEVYEDLLLDPRKWLAKTKEVSIFNIEHSRGGFLNSYIQQNERPLLVSLVKRLAA